MGVIRPNPTVRTVDGATSVKNVDTIKVSNGDLSVSGRTATVDTSGAASISGSIANTQVAFGTGTDTIGGDSDLVFNAGTTKFEVGTVFSVEPTYIHFNSGNANCDFRVDAEWADNLLRTDGSTGGVGINTVPDSDVSLHVEDYNNLDTVVRIESQDATSDAGPILEFFRKDTGAMNKTLGKIEFYGYNAADSKIKYAQIISVVRDATAGGEDGSLDFYIETQSTQWGYMRLGTASQHVQFNPDNRDIDFRVDTGTLDNFFRIDAGTNVASFKGRLNVNAVVEHLIEVIPVTTDVTLDGGVEEVGGQYYVNSTGSEQDLTLPTDAQIGSRFSFSVGSSGSSVKIIAPPGHNVNGASDATRTVVNDVNWCTCVSRDGSGNLTWIMGNA